MKIINIKDNDKSLLLEIKELLEKDNYTCDLFEKG